MQSKEIHQHFMTPVQFHNTSKLQSSAFIYHSDLPLKVGDVIRINEKTSQRQVPTGSFILRIATMVTRSRQPIYHTTWRYRYIVRVEKLG